ncbi:MAG TPA: flavin reductase family protein [Candidatus Limnocylindria bacterium]|nr:flavin reductase family protein [Candidatus Limnocylindria bacterium]
MPVDRERYRALAGAFPTGVTIISTRDADGAPRGLTTQAFIGLSTDPPLVLVAIDRSSRTLVAVRASGVFVVNFLRAEAEAVATRFATKADDKFSGVAWRPSAVAAGAPILHEASAAYAECIVQQELEAGDHFVFVARVEGGEVLEGPPLMYYRRTYAAWPQERPAPPIG